MKSCLSIRVTRIAVVSAMTPWLLALSCAASMAYQSCHHCSSMPAHCATLNLQMTLMILTCRYYTGRKYACWGIGQLRYILGGHGMETSGGQSFMVGYGETAPTHIPNPAASCAASITDCASPISTAQPYLTTAANPHVLYGALVAGPSQQDSFTDDRTGLDTLISLEYNGGLSAALAIAAGQDWGICSERAGLLDQVGAHGGQ